ncbi:hypothetical protein ACFOEW_15800 [Alteromonas oceani]|uniref:Uncharacterized protein n=1 Tax=Alteromonas oceani TaxID=2071609 RepID=A0ABV7K2P0_9ALTE|nr:hypothetical protein [Alteromonas oceani]
MSTHSKKITFHMLLDCANSFLNLAKVFMAFSIFPLVHETVAFWLGWKGYVEANFQLNDYFYYNIVCLAVSLLMASAALVVNRSIDEN